jgi:peptidoglycan/xylan/chitin deacetylase (PgdA/CDA1 family)
VQFPVFFRILPAILFTLVFAPAALAQNENQAVILQYHHVSTSMPPVTSLSPEAFTTHMRYLAENGFTILPLEQVVAALSTGSALPNRSAVITFDDGYTSVYEVAFPVLHDHGWPFTVFVTAGLVGSNDRLYATWQQIREMAEAGATIANHTVSHPYLLERTPDQSDKAWLDGVRREIVDAERVILEQTGQNHRLLAYPYGEYNSQIQALVRELGFTGIAQHSGPINASSDFSALPRFPLSGIYASMNTYPTKVQSLAFTLDARQPDNPVTNSSMPGAALDFANDQEGIDQLVCFNNNEAINVVSEDRAEKIFRVSTHIDNRSRRFRYNCTAPGRNGRYYWYSIPWVNPTIGE